MKRIHLFLFGLIITSIAAKVELAPPTLVHPVVSSSDNSAERFFRYRVNYIQEASSTLNDCTIKIPQCCHA